MAIEPDKSTYGGQSVNGTAWVDLDEEVIGHAANKFKELAGHIRDEVIPAAQKQMFRLIDQWDGSGSEAARQEASNIISNHEANAKTADEVGGKLDIIAAAIVRTKNAVNYTANGEFPSTVVSGERSVQDDCETIMSESPPSPDSDKSDTREDRKNTKIKLGLVSNQNDVSTNTVKLASDLKVHEGTPGADGKMPDSQSPGSPPEGKDGPGAPQSQNVEPPVPGPPGPGAPPIPPKGGPAAPQGEKVDTPVPGPPGPGAPPIPPKGRPGAPQSENLEPPAPSANPPVHTDVPAPATPPVPSLGSGGGPPSPGGRAPSPSMSGPSPSSPSTPSAPTHPAGLAGPPPTPLEQFQKAFEDASKAAGAQAPLPPQTTAAPSQHQPLGPPAPAQSPGAPVASPAPTAPSSPSAVPAAATGGLSSAGPAPVGTPGMSGAPGTGMPLGAPPTPAPAAPATSTGGGAPVGPPPTASGAASSAVAAPAPIPVSAARAERDAAARALRRSDHDPIEVARRIAAALNVGPKDPRFMWLTALTKDGSIVVANNYGLAYIPENVKLPEQVKFVSADESISPQQRGTWATYPMLALHGWAQARDTTLRVVIGLEEQLKGFDSGAASIVLQPDDLPEDGTMQGRSRLAVIAPDVSERLAKIPDSGLLDLLPPAPVDPQPPEDRRVKLLMEVFRPLLIKDPARISKQLKAMIVYAGYMYEAALHRAYTASDPGVLRAAITEALYWQHLGVLNSDAVAEDPS